MITRQALIGPLTSAGGNTSPIRPGDVQAYASALVLGPLISPTPPLMVKGSAACPLPFAIPLALWWSISSLDQPGVIR
nr:Hypothetical protein [Aeromonas caviae]